MFKKVNTNLNFVENENIIEKYWKDNKVNELCLKHNEENKDNNSYVFYDGPPTANGKPHIGHVETRAFKDLIPRFHAMKGAYVPRKAGWDTHGLPVELEVEKQLGINGKEQIEKYGIEPFIEKCKENVWKYKGMWEDFSYKVAFNADMDNPYVTYYNDYIESEWWALKTLFDKGLLYKSFKIVPYCPRCGTPLSSHEVAQGYKDIKTKTAVVRFKIKDKNEYFLAWTTTPWTLPSNLGLCVNPGYEYVKIKCIDGYTYILAKELIDSVLSCIKTENDGDKKYEIIESYKGRDLVGMAYEPLYPYAVDIVNKQKKKAFVVVADNYVTSENGTGIVHIAPAFGEDDNRVCAENGIGFVQFVDQKGMMTNDTDFAGKTVLEADPLVLKNLKERDLLFDAPVIEHSYPHCWRCNTPLIYYARESWFIKMTAVKDKLINNNNMINWYPESIGKGRFGDWLENVQDWGISRNRYWGTPLNIWECEDCGHRIAIGSREELKEKAQEKIDNAKDIELHRPFIDDIHVTCHKCGKRMTRVKEVIDCWFDSGAMPYAQHHYPFENEELFKSQFPASFICEAVDQTRGWFYSLLAESTLLFDKPCFKNCLVLGHVQDEHGQKMSKSKGNAVEPMEALLKFGADSIRWFFYTNSAPWLPKRFSEKAVLEGQSKFLGTLHNAYAFFVLYANIDNFNPKDYTFDKKNLSKMDKWLLSKLNITIKNVTDDLDNFRITEASQKISRFVDELSNWYIRRNRDRFWASGMGQDKINAYFTLYETLVEFSKLIAPFVPFISEEIYLNLVKSVDDAAPISIHMCSYPKYNDEFIDSMLDEEMETTIKIVELGRSARNEAKIKNRQPLKKMLVKTSVPLDNYYQNIIASELNIKTVEFHDDLQDYTSYVFKPQLKTVGPKYGKLLNGIKEHLLNMDTSTAYSNLKKDGFIEFEVAGEKVKLAEEDLIIEASKKEGFITAIDGINTVVLDITLDDELIEEGYIREIVSKIQTMRKESNFDVLDKINVYIYGNEYIESLSMKHIDMLKKDIMSKEIIVGKGSKNATMKEWEINDKTVSIGIEK
ncbi:MAG: isoleucine--tRNA ligase [Lachnospiraceae bacterium]|nr:isoleucine--tRNA ligase [Lachnospiraceae bacterium]